MVTCASKEKEKEKNDTPNICMYFSMCICVFICRLYKAKV